MWKKGPMPPDTWNWGGAVPKSLGEKSTGFFFADFCGDHAKVFDKAGWTEFTIVKGEDILWYNNALSLPPRESGVVGRAS